MKSTTFNIMTLLPPLVVGVVIFFLAGSANALCCRVPGSPCANYAVASCFPYQSCATCPNAAMDDIVKASTLEDLLNVERAEALLKQREAVSPMSKADYPVERRAVEGTVIGDSVKKSNPNEILTKRDAQESALFTGADHLRRSDPFKPYRPKPEPKPGHGGHCCNTACSFPGCAKCATSDTPCTHGGCNPQACSHGLTMEDVQSLEARSLGGDNAKLVDEGLRVVRKAKDGLEERSNANDVVQKRHAQESAFNTGSSNLPRAKPYKPKPKTKKSCCKIPCKGTSCPQCAIVEDKPCVFGTCPAAACNLDLTIEDVMSLDARSLLQGYSANEVKERKHVDKDFVEERKLAAQVADAGV